MTLDDRLDKVWNDARNDPLEEAYGFTIKEATQAILSDLLEIIEEDENPKGTRMVGVPSVQRDQLRQELRERVKKYCE